MFERPVLAEERDLYIISDDAYSDYVVDPRGLVSAAAFDPEKLNTIVCNTLSKNYGMSGWRLGYVITNAELLHQSLKVGLRGRFLKCGYRKSVNQECGVNIGSQDKCECSGRVIKTVSCDERQHLITHSAVRVQSLHRPVQVAAKPLHLLFRGRFSLYRAGLRLERGRVARGGIRSGAESDAEEHGNE